METLSKSEENIHLCFLMEYPLRGSWAFLTLLCLVSDLETRVYCPFVTSDKIFKLSAQKNGPCWKTKKSVMKKQIICGVCYYIKMGNFGGPSLHFIVVMIKRKTITSKSSFPRGGKCWWNCFKVLIRIVHEPFLEGFSVVGTYLYM